MLKSPPSPPKNTVSARKTPITTPAQSPESKKHKKPMQWSGKLIAKRHSRVQQPLGSQATRLANLLITKDFGKRTSQEAYAPRLTLRSRMRDPGIVSITFAASKSDKQKVSL